MAQIQIIKRRIRSVTNTRQITKAMELVSASKMKRAQEAVLRSKPYIAAIRDVIRQLFSATHPEIHPFFTNRTIKSELIIVVSSDRGLAGAYNSNILRALLTRLQANRETDIVNRVIALGNKAAQLASLLETVTLEGIYVNMPTEPTSVDVRPISKKAMSLYLQRSVDRVVIITTEYHSTLHQEVSIRQILPMSPSKNIASDDHAKEVFFEPSPDEVLSEILPRFIEAEIFQLILEANASEHSMRMMAMKNASDNAQSLVEDLTQHYNSARQAAITQELAEISSGTEAIQQ